MNGKRLAQGLLNATGDDLRLVYALVMETKMLDLLVAKSKDVFNKDLNHFEIKLQEEIERLRDYSDEELQLKLFLYIAEQLDVQGAYFNLPAEIDHACEQIVQKAHELQKKQDKSYRTFAEQKEHDYDVSSILVLYQMQKIFESFDEEHSEMSEVETDQLADQIEAYIASLPADKQQQIKNKLHIDELTNNTVKQLIATQGTAILMAVIVEVAGFAAFTTLTSAIATTVGFFGITLPFGAYMFATSALSILTGPVGLALMAVGGGYLINLQNKKVRNTLLPIGVVQLLLPAMIEEESVEYERFIGLWNRLLDRHIEYKSDLKKVELQLEELREDKRLFEGKLKETKGLIAKIEASCSKALSEIEEQIDTVELADMSPKFTELTARIGMLHSQVGKLETEQQQNSEKSGIWNKVKGVVANSSLSSQIKKLEKEWIAVKEERVFAVVEMKPKHLVALCEQVQTSQTELKEAEQEREWLEERITEKKNDIEMAERKEKYARGDLKDFQKVWYGFSQIE